MKLKFYKYQGAGNDFLIADNRDGHIVEKDGFLSVVMEDGAQWTRSIADLCDRRYGVGADGLCNACRLGGLTDDCKDHHARELGAVVVHHPFQRKAEKAVWRADVE